MAATLLKITDLHKGFLSGDNTLKVLKGVNLSVEEGEFLSIVGQSGTGKSTLLHIMGGLDRPDRGEISFQGVDIFSGRGADLDRYRNRSVGFVFQFHHLLSEFTALENVMMPALAARLSRGAAGQAAEKLLSEVRLENRLHHRPGQLSGGEQQRVAVARALVMSPRLLLADEPTGNLDSENSQALFQLLREINRSRSLTVVMVTHNRELAAATDRIMILAGGILSGNDTSV